MTWDEILKNERDKNYFKKLQSTISNERLNKTVYPDETQVENALKLTPFDDVKCVILGQDPYPNPNQAMGLAFSVNKNVSIPRSLQNIYKELQQEYNYPIPNNGDLTPWAKQGVLLLNSTLTVEKGKAGSHFGLGWEIYTDKIIDSLNNSNHAIVFMLWGKKAQEKATLITNKSHLILTAPHPSPYSANTGFFGCEHFKKCNEFLMSLGQAPINWQINDI